MKRNEKAFSAYILGTQYLALHALGGPIMQHIRSAIVAGLVADGWDGKDVGVQPSPSYKRAPKDPSTFKQPVAVPLYFHTRNALYWRANNLGVSAAALVRLYIAAYLARGHLTGQVSGQVSG